MKSMILNIFNLLIKIIGTLVLILIVIIGILYFTGRVLNIGREVNFTDKNQSVRYFIKFEKPYNTQIEKSE